MSARWVIKTAAELKYDGVELLASGPVVRNFDELKSMTDDLGLSLHIHQAWSHDESNAPSLSSWIMEKIGYLPGTGSSPLLLPGSVSIPKIVYAHWITLEQEQDREDFWFQTCPVRFGKTHSISHEKFERKWHMRPVPICWDFQHSLEWQTGETMNPANFQNVDPNRLEGLLMRDFDCYRSKLKEIHWTDSDPSLGHKGLNVMPGTGILAKTGIMKNLCQFIMKSDWRGCIVPEVGLQSEVPKGPRHLKEVLAKIKGKAEEAFS